LEAEGYAPERWAGHIPGISLFGAEASVSYRQMQHPEMRFVSQKTTPRRHIMHIKIRPFVWLLLACLAIGQAADYNTQALRQIHTHEHAAKQAGGFSFAVMGDNRGGNAVLATLLTRIRRNGRVAFVLNNGDLTQDGYVREYQRYLDVLHASGLPVLSVIGNHEIPWYDGETNYQRFFGKSYFSFRYRNSCFIVLDDADEKGLAKQQIQWLTHELQQSQSCQNRFVFLHVPLYDPRKGAYRQGHSLHNLKAAQKLNDLFDRYHVTMVFASHIHAYFRGQWHRTPYIITGGAGAPLQKGSFFHYIRVDVHGTQTHCTVIKVPAKDPGWLKRTFRSAIDAMGI